MGIRKNTVKINTALISLSDKSNLRPLLNLLYKNKIKIISSGGTYNKIRAMGFKCQQISKFTNKSLICSNSVPSFNPVLTVLYPLVVIKSLDELSIVDLIVLSELL